MDPEDYGDAFGGTTPTRDEVFPGGATPTQDEDFLGGITPTQDEVVGDIFAVGPTSPDQVYFPDLPADQNMLENFEGIESPSALEAGLMGNPIHYDSAPASPGESAGYNAGSPAPSGSPGPMGSPMLGSPMGSGLAVGEEFEAPYFSEDRGNVVADNEIPMEHYVMGPQSPVEMASPKGSGEYDPNDGPASPTVEEYDPIGPASPTGEEYIPTGPGYDPDGPASPTGYEYIQEGPVSPTVEEYDPNGPTSPAMEEYVQEQPGSPEEGFNPDFTRSPSGSVSQDIASPVGSPVRFKLGSTSPAQSGSPHPSPGSHRSRSGSPAGSDRSRSGSPTGSNRSRSGSPAGSDRSRSGSPAGSNRSRSGSPAGSDRSRSGSPAGSNRSRSGSPTGSNRSRSGSPAGSDRSRSGSPAGSDRSRSGSPAGSDRSRSGSPAGSNRSRSGSNVSGRSGTPRSRSGSNVSMRSGSRSRSRSHSGSRSRSGSNLSRRSGSIRSGSRSRSGSPRSRSGSPGSRDVSPARSVGSGPASPPGSPRGSDAESDVDRSKKNKIKDSDDEGSEKGSVVGELIADIFGESDEDEDFQGFGAADVEAHAKKDKAKTAVVSDDDEGDDAPPGRDGEGAPAISSDEGLDDDRKGPGEDFVSDFDLMIQKKKDEMRKKRRKRKDVEMINDNDDLIAAMMQNMKQAAEEDRDLNSAKKPAVMKLKLLPKVMAQLRKADLHEAFLDCNILSAMTEWLAPLPDKSLPHLKIRECFLRQMLEFPPINTELLKTSGMGKAIMYLYKHPREVRSNKTLAGKLVNEWSRPIFHLTSNYKSLSREEREQRDYEQLPKKRKLSLEGSQTPQRDIDKALQGEEQALRPGDPGYIMRARVPQPSKKDYVIRPKWTIEEKPSRSGGKKKMDRFERHLKEYKDKKAKKKQAQRAVTISVEGRNMSL